MTTKRTWVLAAMLALAACGTDGGEPGGEPGDGDATKALYAVMFEVYDDVGSNSYLSLVDSLDTPALDATTAREFAGGRAFVRAYNGWLFVGAPDKPEVTRFEVAADGTLGGERKVGFGNYGFTAGEIDPWNLTFISPTKAYLFDYKEATTVVWNPTTMEITGDILAPKEFLRAGLNTETSPAALRGKLLFRPIFWANYDTAEYSTEHLLAIYDVEKDEIIDMVTETRCPAPGNRTHVDEQGNIYFSNWIWPVAGTLLREAPTSCVLRIRPDQQTYDPDWTLSYAELSSGHEGAMFTYLGSGQALVSIFDDGMSMFDATTDPWELAGRIQWRVWNIDMGARKGAPVDGIPLNSGAYTPLSFEGRSFAMVPTDTWEATQLYEIEGGKGTPGMKIPGWSYQFVKVR